MLPPTGAFNWRNVAGLRPAATGALRRRALPTRLNATWCAVSVSDGCADISCRCRQTEPFGQIYRPANHRYDWGSNQLILQNIIVLSAAYDLSGDKAFLNAARESMDYILGRNAMAMSYITGYGSALAREPAQPLVCASGGPDRCPIRRLVRLPAGRIRRRSMTIAKQRLQGCAPQTCYVDDIEAYGSNEITINWNAPLVYVASFLADAR